MGNYSHFGYVPLWNSKTDIESIDAVGEVPKAVAVPSGCTALLFSHHRTGSIGNADPIYISITTEDDQGVRIPATATNRNYMQIDANDPPASFYVSTDHATNTSEVTVHRFYP